MITKLLSDFHLDCHVYNVRGSSSFISGRLTLLAALSRQFLLKSCDDELILPSGQAILIPPDTGLSMFTQRRTELLLISFDSAPVLRDQALMTFLDHRIHQLPSDSSLFMHMAECGRELSFYDAQDAGGRDDGTTTLSQRWTLSLLQDLYSLAEREFEESFTLQYSHLSPRSASLLKKILTLLRQEGDSVPGLSTAAQFADVTPQYLASFFREHMGKTFMQYRKELLDKSEALREIYGSALPQTEFIGAEVISNINTVYSILSAASVAAPKSPASYEIGPDLSVPASPAHRIPAQSAQKPLYSVQNPAVQMPSVYSAPPPRVIPADSPGEGIRPSFFNKMINLGFAFQFSDERFWSQLRMAQSDIRFEYGRICGIMDLISEYKLSGSVQSAHVDYSRVFRVLDGIQSLDLTPFLELSGRGFLLQLSTHESISLSQTDNTTQYNRFLIGILPSFLAACINRYGRDNVKKWKFEMIYPFTDFDKSYPLWSYAETFRAFRDILHRFLPGCEVCGPGFNDWSDPSQIQEVLDVLSRADALPDSFSVFLYPVYGRPGDYRISSDPGLISARLTDFCQRAQSFLPGSRIWVTEYNSNLSARCPLNDSVLQAAYLAALYARILRLPLQGFGYYMLTDIPLRYIDTDSFLFGGWGLISDCGIPKPSFYAMRYIQALGTEILFQDQGCIVTKKGNAIRCLLFPKLEIPEHFLNTRAQPSENSTEAAWFMCAPDPTLPPADIVLQFSGLSAGHYQVTIWILSESSGNLLRVFHNTGFRRPATESAMEAFRLLGKPFPVLQDVKVGANCEMSLTLPGTVYGTVLLMIDPVTAPPQRLLK